MKRTASLALLLALALSPAATRALAQASASSGHPDNEGCWCGFQTNVVRNYVIRGQGATSAHKEAAADMIREWNRYANLFTVSVDTGSTLGSQNGTNEVNVFISSAESKARYGIELEPSTFGVAVMFPRAAFGNFNQCRSFSPSGCGAYNETDVVVNAAFPTGWTGDWYAPGSDTKGGTALVQATVLHEVGHTLGLHHVFDLAPGAGRGNSLSTMNYLNDDVGRFVTRIDSKTIRAEYPGRAGTLRDMAIFPFVYGNDQYEQTYAAPSKTSVVPGESFTLSNWLVQNVGNQSASSIRVTFYLVPIGSRKYPQSTDVPVGNVDVSSAGVDAEQVMTSTPLVVPASAAAGDYWLGAIVTVGGSEDSAYVAGKPSNNRFLVGHNPFTTIRVLPGSGGTAVVADFSFAPASPQASQTVTFTDLSRGSPTGWSWKFGDGGTATSKNPDHVYASAGTYTVTLTASSAGSSSTASRTVTVVPKPGTGTSSVASMVPIVLDLPGRFSSELTLTNSGTSTATIRLRYTAAPVFGGAGSGVTSAFTLGAGLQLVIPDAIAYLRSKGLSIPSGNQGGSLRVEFEGLSNAGAGFASARTTAPISGVGRAGLSYPGVNVSAAYTEPVAIFGLRQNTQDRSNLAMVNASTTSPATLTVTVIKGDGTTGLSFAPETLQPGVWKQYDGILSQAGGYDEGWMIIEPASTVPYLAYGVFNDGPAPGTGTGDGSYVPAVAESKVDALLGVPVLVEIGSRYSSELIVTSLWDEPVQCYIEFVESLANGAVGGVSTGVWYLELGPFQQAIIPDIIDELRQAGAPIGPKGGSYAGSLTVLFANATSLTPGLAGARTSNPSTAPAPPGYFGLFYTGDPFTTTARDAWVYGLQQNSSTRSNLAIVNAGVTNTPIKLRLEIYNGATGQLATRQTIGPLQPLQWTQLDSVLSKYVSGVTNGYARLTVVEGDGTFYAYGVINDGASPGQGTGDGSYVSMVVNQ